MFIFKPTFSGQINNIFTWWVNFIPIYGFILYVHAFFYLCVYIYIYIYILVGILYKRWQTRFFLLAFSCCQVRWKLFKNCPKICYNPSTFGHCWGCWYNHTYICKYIYIAVCMYVYIDTWIFIYTAVLGVHSFTYMCIYNVLSLCVCV